MTTQLAYSIPAALRILYARGLIPEGYRACKRVHAGLPLQSSGYVLSSDLDTYANKLKTGE